MSKPRPASPARRARKSALGRYLRKVRGTFPLLPYETRAANWRGEERARLAKRTPAFADGQIAAVAAVNEVVLVTANTADFADFVGLQIANWMS